MDAAVVRDSIRASEAPFPCGYPYRVNRHKPNAGYAEIAKLRDATPGRVKCPFFGKRARKDFIDYGISYPVRAGNCPVFAVSPGPRRRS